MVDTLPPYRRIYFDTNVLVRARWPRLSQTMRTALLTASHLAIPTILLQSVEHELRAHCVRNLTEICTQIIDNTHKLASLCEGLDDEWASSLPSQRHLEEAYDKAANENVAAFHMLRKAPSLRKTDEMFEMAIHKKKPFGEKGKNFQDAVICLAAIDDLVSSSDHVGAFVSRDDIFEQQTLDDLCKRLDVNMRVFKDEVALNDDMRTFLRRQAAKEWIEDEELASIAINESLPALQEFIEANLEVRTRFGFTSRILTISRIQVVKVTRVETPSPWDRLPGETLTITAQVLIHIFATVRRVASAPSEIVLKVGATAQAARSAAQHTPLYSDREEVLERTVDVELSTAFSGGRYINLKPISVAIGTSRSDATPAADFASPRARIGSIRP